MNLKRVFTVSNRNDLERCYPVMKELRPHLSFEDYISIYDQSHGAELLKYAENIARDQGCKSLRLCTGIENGRGVQFYDRNGWTKRAYAYTKKLNGGI